MKHEDFKSWIEKNCMYETFYEDSEGRTIMIVTEMDAWMMCNKFAEAKSEWVGLTDEEIDKTIKACNTSDTYKYFRAIEAKLKEKNT